MCKYLEIVEWLKAKINEGMYKPGDKIYSENKLAEIFKVSRQTVRKAIQILVEEEIVERRHGSGNYIAGQESMKKNKKRHMRIAIITTCIDEYVYPIILDVMEKQLSEAGYVLQISSTNNSIEKERMILKEILGRNDIDGMIVEPTQSGLPSPNIGLYRRLEENGIKIVFLHSAYPELNYIHVSMNDRAAGKMATEHLLSSGHRNIGAVFKSDDGQGHLRYAGYCEALRNRGIKVRGERIKWIDTYEQEHMLEYPLEILARLKDCTACVCYNDQVASKLVSIYKDNNMNIPDTLSIVGIDNGDVAKLCEVPITSVNNPIQRLAIEASKAMILMCDGGMKLDNIELDPTLVIRNSVAIIDSIGD